MHDITYHYVKRKAILICFIGVLFLLIGEIAFRLPSAPDLLRYAPDKELGFRYAPQQTFTGFMGNYSVQTPPITIDENGFRNAPVYWKRPIVLALGSSEVEGPGLTYEEIWTSRLTRLLSKDSNTGPLVVNAAVGGYGPYHQSVVLRRFLKEQKRPGLVIVRVSIGDRLFFPPTPHELSVTKLKRIKTFVYGYSDFMPFLYKKTAAQLYAIRNSMSINRKDKVLSREYEKVEAAEKMWKKHKAYWIKITSLCEENNVSVLFYVSDAYGTPGGKKLFELFNKHFNNSQVVSVFIIDESYFNVSDRDLDRRREKFKKQFTLGYDPHANSLQHKIIADTLFDYLRKSMLLKKN